MLTRLFFYRHEIERKKPVKCCLASKKGHVARHYIAFSEGKHRFSTMKTLLFMRKTPYFPSINIYFSPLKSYFGFEK